jgi:hypothetical protein
MPYPVIEVSEDAVTLLEQLGTKRKYWLVRNGSAWMFKQGREGTGEDWAEKATCEIARAIGLPHASYELARSAVGQGVLTPKFLADDATLTLGNELLSGQFARYETEPRYRRQSHTINRVNTVFLPVI